MNGTQVLKGDAVPGWQISGFVEYIEAGHKQGDMLLVVPEGSYAVRLGNDAAIKQTIASLTVGSFFSVSFSAARTCAQDEKLNITVAPDSGSLPIQTLYSSNGWDSYAWAFKATSTQTELIIHNPGQEEDPFCGPLIDAVAIKKLQLPLATDHNLLVNGDFEEGPYIFKNAAWGVLVPPNIEDDHCPLPGWMVESLKAVKYVDNAHFSVPRGGRAVELVAGRESALTQVVKTAAGKVYILSFSVGDASNSCEGSMVVEAFASRETIKVPYQSKGKGGFRRAYLRFTAAENRSRIMFFSSFYHIRSDDSSSLCGPVVDDVRVVGLRSFGMRGRSLLHYRD
ncbi:BIIDXI-like protein At5g11420 [Wolffia australiana]